MATAWPVQALLVRFPGTKQLVVSNKIIKKQKDMMEGMERPCPHHVLFDDGDT